MSQISWLTLGRPTHDGGVTNREPAIFLSHGAPPLADDRLWTTQLRDWGRSLRRPSAILMVSAHWEQRPIALSASQTQVPLVYDFYGFPDRYYLVTYSAPAAPELADEVTRLINEAGHQVDRDETRGLDHGAYVPLKEMFPAADVPVLQLSMPTLDPRTLFQIGTLLAPLRDQDVLIVGSGFTTHNLSWVNFGMLSDYLPGKPSAEFDAWAAATVADSDLESLFDFLDVAPHGREAHPRTEHFAPLFVAMGAAVGADGKLNSRSVIDGFWYGLSKRSWQFD